tara:strand:+ start:281 stop:511 length:231 start_codon:yes stop_codon:yes gene_type:complete
MKPHMKVIQRNGVDIFITSSMTMKETRSALGLKTGRYWAQINKDKSQTLTTTDGIFDIKFLPPYGRGYWMQTKSPS